MKKRRLNSKIHYLTNDTFYILNKNAIYIDSGFPMIESIRNYEDLKTPIKNAEVFINARRTKAIY